MISALALLAAAGNAMVQLIRDEQVARFVRRRCSHVTQFVDGSDEAGASLNKANKTQIAKDREVSNFIQTRFSHRT